MKCGKKAFYIATSSNGKSVPVCVGCADIAVKMCYAYRSPLTLTLILASDIKCEAEVLEDVEKNEAEESTFTGS